MLRLNGAVFRRTPRKGVLIPLRGANTSSEDTLEGGVLYQDFCVFLCGIPIANFYYSRSVQHINQDAGAAIKRSRAGTYPGVTFGVGNDSAFTTKTSPLRLIAF